MARWGSASACALSSSAELLTGGLYVLYNPYMITYSCNHLYFYLSLMCLVSYGGLIYSLTCTGFILLSNYAALSRNIPTVPCGSLPV